MTSHRAAEVGRAIALITSANPADLAGWLDPLPIHDDMKAEPAALIRALADPAEPSDHAYHVAHAILVAAGYAI